MTVLDATVQIVSAKMTNNVHNANKMSGEEVADFIEAIYKKLQELENTPA